MAKWFKLDLYVNKTYVALLTSSRVGDREVTYNMDMVAQILRWPK